MDISILHPTKPRVRVTTKEPQSYCDPFEKAPQRKQFLSFADVKKSRQNVTHSRLMRGHRTSFFVTQDSRKYLLPQEEYARRYKRTYTDPRRKFDSVHRRYVQKYGVHQMMYDRVAHDFSRTRDQLFAFGRMRRWDLSPIRMWQMSMMGAMIFGMITMSMIYKNLGQVALAKGDDTTNRVHALDPMTAMIEEGNKKEQVVVPEREAVAVARELVKSIDAADRERLPIESTIQQKSAEQQRFEEKAREMVAGYPIEEMLPELFKLDREVAIYMIAMAKQESAWGKRKPVLHGGDCFNYWGYRAQRERMGSGGHTCFDDRADAVATVGKRVHDLIYEYQRSTPRQMLVWKCGSSCDGHSTEGVERWVNTVTVYRDSLRS